MKRKSSAELVKLIHASRTVVFCGSGGVGKTTVAAATALHAAQTGRRVLALTIDPARRLANALGLSELDDEPRPLPDEHLEKAGLRLDGSLEAMMLDPKRAMDRLVEKYALNENMKKVIFSNPVYIHGSEILIGSPEYLAMERLYELHGQDRYDLIILDTPPTKHALDFLSAPSRMVNFLEDNRLLKALLQPGYSAGKLGMRAFQLGTSVLLKAIERVTGSGFIQAGIDFLTAFEGMFAGFHDRARHVNTILRDDRTAFVVVASPRQTSIQEALYFYENLAAQSILCSGFILNRVHEDLIGDPEKQPNLARLYGEWSARMEVTPGKGLPSPLLGGDDPLPAKLVEGLLLHQRQSHLDQRNIAGLRGKVSAKTWVSEVPELEEHVFDLEGLLRIGAHLFPE